jgi:hypothetical protein
MNSDAVRLEWSRWSRCESSFNLLLAPQQPGIFALAEEVMDVAATGKRMLAVLDVGPADDLSRTLSWLFSPASALRDRLLTGRCFVRYAVVPDLAQRDAVVEQLRQWIAAATEVAGGLVQAVPAAEPAPLQERRDPVSPAPLPAGF